MPYFFARRDGDRAFIDGADARHLARSLRARAGEVIEVVDPAGVMLTVRLLAISDTHVEGEITAERPHHPEPAARITIAIANLPAASLELVLSRCTEAGAHAFAIVQADRSVANGAKPERWSAICREAAMLAGRLVVPAVTSPAPLNEVLKRAENPVLLARETSLHLADVKDPSHITLCIGPEGGWTDREVSMAGVRATLGPRNMRADTAAVAALAIALAVRR